MHILHARTRLAGDILKAALASAALLLVPLVAMRLTRAVAWSGADFALAAVLLGSTCLALLRIARLQASTLRRALLTGAVELALAALWVELAVGVFFDLGS